MLPAGGVQHARNQVQQHRGGRFNVRLGDCPRAAQGALTFVELAQPKRHTGNRPERGREYRPVAPAVTLGQDYCLPSAFARGLERDEL